MNESNNAINGRVQPEIVEQISEIKGLLHEVSANQEGIRQILFGDENTMGEVDAVKSTFGLRNDLSECVISLRRLTGKQREVIEKLVGILGEEKPL